MAALPLLLHPAQAQDQSSAASLPASLPAARAAQQPSASQLTSSQGSPTAHRQPAGQHPSSQGSPAAAPAGSWDPSPLPSLSVTRRLAQGQHLIPCKVTEHQYNSTFIDYDVLCYLLAAQLGTRSVNSSETTYIYNSDY